MEEERVKGLYTYLQKVVQFSFDLYAALEDPELTVDLYKKLKPLYDELRNALHSAYPMENSFDDMLKRELGFSLATIPKRDNASYFDVLMSTIEQAESQGYLLQLIIAAYKRNPQNPSLRVFIIRDLKQLIEGCISSPQKQVPAQSMPASSPSPTEIGRDGDKNGGNARVRRLNGKSDGHDVDISKHVDTVVIDTDGQHRQEIDDAFVQKQPTPLPARPAIGEKQLPPKEALSQANGYMGIARNAIELVHSQFQSVEQIDEDEAIDQVNEAKAHVEKIVNIVAPIPTPDYRDLHFRTEFERDFFHEKAALIALSLQKKKNQSLPTRFLYTIQKDLSELLESLGRVEKMLEEFQLQVERSEQVDDGLSEASN